MSMGAPKPIATAPHDINLLLWCGNFFAIGKYDSVNKVWVRDHQRTRLYPDYWYDLPGEPLK